MNKKDDPIAIRIEKLLSEEPQQRETFSSQMAIVRQFLAASLEVNLDQIQKRHVIQYLKGTSDDRLLRLNGIGKAALKKLRAEIDAYDSKNGSK